MSLENARPSLGATVPVALFRALRVDGMMTGLDAAIGDASTLVYNAGRIVGTPVGKAIAEAAGGDLNAFLGGVVQTAKDLGIGVISLVPDSLNAEGMTLRVDECVTCAGGPVVGKKICHFEGGFVASVVEGFTGKNAVATETHCNANGDDACIFDVRI
jgi:uncharacterized protein